MTPALTDEEVNSEAELLKSRDVLEQVVLANGHAEGTWQILSRLLPSPADGGGSCRASRAMLASKIKVETPPKTDLIEVTYSSSDPPWPMVC